MKGKDVLLNRIEHECICCGADVVINSRIRFKTLISAISDSIEIVPCK